MGNDEAWGACAVGPIIQCTVGSNRNSGQGGQSLWQWTSPLGASGQDAKRGPRPRTPNVRRARNGAGGRLTFAAANKDFRAGGNCGGGIDVRCHGPLGERDKNHNCHVCSVLLRKVVDR